MRKKIAILGSTGSIGKSTINILRKDKNESIDLTVKLHPSDAARLERRLSN